MGLTIAAATPAYWNVERDRHGRKHRYRKHAHRRHQKHAPPRPRYGQIDPSPFAGIDLGPCRNDVLGGVLGTAAGAAVGSAFGKGDGRVAAILAGAVVGALTGSAVGHSIDQSDPSCFDQVLASAPAGQTIAWSHPERDTRYELTPGEEFATAEGRYCREYTQTAVIGGRTQQIYGTACR